VLTNNGAISAAQITIPSKYSPSLFSFSDSATGSFSGEFVFTPLQLSTAYLPNIAAMTNGSASTAAVSILLSLPGATASVGGSLSGVGNLGINTLSALINHVTTPTALAILPGSNLATTGSINLSSASTLSIGVNAGTSAQLDAAGGSLSLSAHGQITTSVADLVAKTGMTVNGNGFAFTDNGGSTLSFPTTAVLKCHSPWYTFGSGSSSAAVLLISTPPLPG